MEDVIDKSEFSQQKCSTSSDHGSAAPDSSNSISVRNSRAIPVWLAIIAVVLAALYLQTQTHIASYNFLIEGNSQMDGAAVTVDGQQAGVMHTLNQGGVTTVGLRLHVGDGSHTVVVSKPGFAPASATTIIKGEDYLGVQLKPLNQAGQN